METVDVVVIGAGIAGLSAAAELAPHASVVVVEAEQAPTHHATGRSAALFIPTYGPPNVRRLTAASADFFHSLADGRSDTPLVTPRTVMYITDEANRPHLDDAVENHDSAGGELELIDGDDCMARCPSLRRDWIAAGGLDHDAHDMDVAAIVSVFRSTLAAAGGRLLTDHRVTAIDRDLRGWRLATTAGPISAGTIVNAAGAWADEIAALAGIKPIGFIPKRRTIGVGPIADGADAGDHFVAHVAMQFYFGAEAGGLLFSPADETPSEPCDARPEEVDVAIAIDRINQATQFGLRSVRQTWAGLRTFSPDGDLVLGPDPTDEAFVWCAGQGGYGIHTAPAAAAATAALTLGVELPEPLRSKGLSADAVLPARFGDGE